VHKRTSRFFGLAALAALFLCLPPRPVAAQNLVTNGGFETGDLTGWTTVAGSNGFHGVAFLPRSGNHSYISNGGSASSPNIIEQAIATTPGQSYTVTFYPFGFGGPGAGFRALWDGVEFFSEPNDSDGGYEERTFTLVATDSSTVLRFESFVAVVSWFLDDVSVVALAPVDTTPPTITASANKTQLSPPNGKLVTVTVTGTITDASEIASVTYTVEDEYGLVEPSGSAEDGQITIGDDGDFSFAVKLRASRRGEDTDGRLYTIHITATDSAGNTATYPVEVLVPHDSGS